MNGFALVLPYKCSSRRRNCENFLIERQLKVAYKARGHFNLKIGCHVLPWGLWTTKDTSYTWDGRKWKITLAEALHQISTLKYQGVDCSDGDLAPYFGEQEEFRRMLAKTNLEFAGVWSTIFPKKLAPSERIFVDPDIPMSDPNQFRGLSIGAITEQMIREDLASKKALVGILASLGAQVLVTGGPFMLRGDMREEYYRITGSYLNEIGEDARAHGMRLVHHPHLGTLVERWKDIELLLERTDKKVVGICLDTAHLSAAGVNPMKLIRKHPDRIGHAHIKDLRGGQFVELGEGSVDLVSVLRELKRSGYEEWAISELDIPSRSAYESSASNKKVLDKLLATTS